MNVMEQIKNRVIALCESQNISVEALVQMSGIEPGYMQEFIEGIAEDMELKDLFRLSFALGLSLPDFFDDPVFGSTQNDAPLPAAENPHAEKDG